MANIKISLVASAIRTKVWERFINSTKGNKYPIEIIFVGDVKPDFPLPPNFKHIHTSVKPAQCYEIGFRAATGELIGWTADDAIYDNQKPNNLDIAYDFYKTRNNEKLVVAMYPIEDQYHVWRNHHFFGKQPHTPYMAPMGLMNRKLFHKLGGYDRRFICGQAENDIVMRAYEIGGSVELCREAVVYIDHIGTHKWSSHDFRVWYPQDRVRLENCWVKQGYGAYNSGHKYTVSEKRLLPVERFEDENILTISAEPKGRW